MPHFSGLLKIALLSIVCSQTLIVNAGSREDQIAFSYAKLNEVNLEHAKFRRVRDEKILSATGINASYDSYDEASLKWLGNWYRVIELVKFADRLTDSELVDFSKKLESELKAQTEEFYKLKEKSLGLQNDLSETRRLIEACDSLVPAVYPSSYQEIIQRFNQDLESGKTSVKSIENNMHARQKKFLQATQDLRNKLLDGLREKLIATGSNILMDAINQALKVLAADQMITAENEDARVKFNQFSRLSSFYFYFHSIENGAELKNTIQQAIARIQSADLPVEWKDVGIENLNRYVQRIDSQISFIKGKGARPLLLSSHKRLVFAFSKKCEVKVSLVNCQLVETMSRLTDSQLNAMTDEKQKNLERLWLTVGQL